MYTYIIATGIFGGSSIKNQVSFKGNVVLEKGMRTPPPLSFDLFQKIQPQNMVLYRCSLFTIFRKGVSFKVLFISRTDKKHVKLTYYT